MPSTFSYNPTCVEESVARIPSTASIINSVNIDIDSDVNAEIRNSLSSKDLQLFSFSKGSRSSSCLSQFDSKSSPISIKRMGKNLGNRGNDNYDYDGNDFFHNNGSNLNLPHSFSHFSHFSSFSQQRSPPKFSWKNKNKNNVFNKSDFFIEEGSATVTPTAIRRLSILDLPEEVLIDILIYVFQNESKKSLYANLSCFKSNILPVCATFYRIGIKILYNHAAFGHPVSFDRFLNNLKSCSPKGFFVRCLDFSDFTSVGLGRTGRMNQEIQMVTAKTINECLHLTPNVTEFLGSESIEQDIDSNVLSTLFSLANIQAIDLTGATGSALTDAFANMKLTTPFLPSLRRLCLHECFTLPSSVYVNLFPKLVSITHLDLTHTQVTSEALELIPESANITHLSLSNCHRLSGPAITRFLVSHPAIRQLEWLNILYAAKNPCPLSSTNLDLILRYACTNLRYLNISGVPINEHHLDLLPTTLKSLSLGYAKIDPMKIMKPLAEKQKKLVYLDLTGNPYISYWTLQDQNFLNAHKNIKLLEFSSDLISKLEGVQIPNFNVIIGQGRRSWMYKSPPAEMDRMNYLTSSSCYSKLHLSCGCLTQSTATHILGMDMTAPDWSYASRKINCSRNNYFSGNIHCMERGIYLYYSFRK